MYKAEKLYQYLKEKRLELRLSQSKLAKSVGVATSTICHIEAGSYTKFPLEKVLALAGVLGVDQDHFALLWIDAVLENQRLSLKRKIFSVR